MRVSIFQHARDNAPKLVDCTWDFLTKNLGPHEYNYANKLETPAFSPAEYPPGAERDADNVIQIWLFVADLDHLDEQTALTTCQRVQAAGLAAIVYTTWRHAEDPWRLRVVLPLSRPVPAAQWREFWKKMNAAFGGICDPKCIDPSRLYFGPYAPAGTEAQNFYLVFPGEALDVDAVIGAANTETDPAREEALRQLGEAWPEEGRHEAQLALAGGLLTSGVDRDEAVEILCRVSAAQDPNNEDRPKREATVDHTVARIASGERVVGWTTLAKHVGADVAMKARRALEAPPKLSANQLRLFAKNLAGKKDDATAELGEALTKVCEGEVYGEAGNRSDLTLRLCSRIGERFPYVDAQSIADLFIPSLQKIGMNNSTCPTLEDIVFAIERKQNEIKSAKIAEMEEQASRIREAFGNGRSTPYTAEELAKFGNVRQRWIIQHDRAFYLFFNGHYTGPLTEASVQNAAACELAPATSAGVQLYTFSKERGKLFKSIKTLVDEYGTVAKSTVLDLTAQETRYIEKDRCLIEAPCPLRPIQPVYHEDIDRWLWLLSGSKYEQLKTWISIVTELDKICVALFLVGRKSVGKSLLPLGLSRLWGVTGPTSLEAVFDNFNDSILACPLTLADEHLPKDFRGFTKNAQLRLHIQQRERTVRRKYMPNTKLVGASRTIIAAHNIGVLKTNEHLSENEIQGIAERLLLVEANPEAATYLESINTFERGWVDQDKIAEHALWLRDNHPRQSEGRFYIQAHNEEVVRQLTTAGGIKSQVCLWLVNYLLNPRLFHNSAYSEMLVRVKNHKLCVNVRGIHQTWDVYVGKSEKPPTIGPLAATLSELCTSERLRYPDKKGTRTNYRVVEIKNLLSWARNNDYSTEEQIVAGLAVDTEITMGYTG